MTTTESKWEVTESGKHIHFVPAPPKKKTKVWWVINKHDDTQLGWISWFGKWRKYSFYPAVETVFEEQCLRDIASFCERMTKEHKRG